MLMKRIILMALAIFAGFTAQAQIYNFTPIWQQSLTPVNVNGRLMGTHTAVAPDGSVYSTGTYNQEITVGSTVLPNDDELTSAYIAKYTANGTGAWAVRLYGSAVISDITVDVDGNVYVLGSLADEVVFGSKDGAEQTVGGMKVLGEYTRDRRAAFIAKYDPNGNLKAVRTILAETDSEITDSGMYLDDMAWITPKQIRVSSGKVYISVMHDGNVNIDQVAWKGRYNFAWGFMYVDNHSAGIMSFDAADLTDATSVANVGAKDARLEDLTYAPSDISFTAAGNIVYVAFVGHGKLTFITPNGAQDITTTVDSEGREYAYAVAAIGPSGARTKVFHSHKDDREAPMYSVPYLVADANRLYLAGISDRYNPFQTNIDPLGATTIFVTALNISDFSLYWSANDRYDEGDLNHNAEGIADIVVNNGKVLLAGYAYNTGNNTITARLNYNISASGYMLRGDDTAYASLADNGTTLSTVINNDKTTTVSYHALNTVDAIPSIDAPNNDKSAVYNISGQYVGQTTRGLGKGLYLVKKGAKTEKVLVK